MSVKILTDDHAGISLLMRITNGEALAPTFFSGDAYEGWPTEWGELSSEQVAKEFIGWLSLPAHMIESKDLYRLACKFIDGIGRGEILLHN